MKTTLAILGIFVAAALVAGTVAVTDSYAITLKFQNAYKSQQNNQNSLQSIAVGQSNSVEKAGGGNDQSNTVNAGQSNIQVGYNCQKAGCNVLSHNNEDDD
jgi:hypothetical protein